MPYESSRAYANSSKGCANNTFLVSAHPNKFLRQKIRKAAQPKKRRKYVSIDKLHASSSEYETQTLHLRQALPNSVAFFFSIFSATTTLLSFLSVLFSIFSHGCIFCVISPAIWLLLYYMCTCPCLSNCHVLGGSNLRTLCLFSVILSDFIWVLTDLYACYEYGWV